MKYSSYFNRDNLLRNPSGRSNRSVLSGKIPPFVSHVIDVDYVEVDLRITDPGRLLPEHSMTPYYMEERRREDMHNGIASLIEDIARLLVKFGRNGLHMPLGVGKCPYGWEQLLYDGILEAFGALTDEIQAALSKFKNAAVVESWILYEGFGCDEDGILQFINDYKNSVLREIIKNDFIHDLLHIGENCAPDDDLPF